MTARHARLAGAIGLARERPVPVEAADAASYVDRLTVVPGTLTVLWHSVMWQYVPREQRARVGTRLAALGAQARGDAPLAHLAAEPTRRTPEAPHEFWVCAETWPPGSEREFLATMAPHGIPVSWE
jgi:hypothetical protein